MLRFFRFGSKKKDKELKGGSELHEKTSLAPLQLLSLDLPSPSLDANNNIVKSASDRSLWVEVCESDLPSPGEYEVFYSRLTVKEVLPLVTACCAEIKGRGLQTLGIFRPYRTGENPARINKLTGLYLKSFQTEIAFTNNKKRLTEDLFDLDSALSPAQAFQEELTNAAGIHDVVFLLKWSLRHLYPGLTFTKGVSTNWFQEFLTLDTSISRLPTNHYSAKFLCLLDKESQELINKILDLIAALSTYSEVNGASSTRLCKTLGFWLLSTERSTAHPYVEEQYEGIAKDWSSCSRAFENIFLAYLREQKDLPKRLKELKKKKRPLIDEAELERDGLLVRLETKGWRPFQYGQEGSAEKSKGRHIGDLFELALSSATVVEADGDNKLWKEIRLQASASGNEKSASFKSVLTDEDCRLINLLSPSHSSFSSESPASLGPESPSRRRSFSVDSPMIPTHPSQLSGHMPSVSETEASSTNRNSQMPRSLSAQIGNFPNKSLTHLPASSMTRSKSAYIPPTPTWSEFMNKGFASDTVLKTDLELDTPFKPLPKSPTQPIEPKQHRLKRSSSQSRTKKKELQSSTGTNSTIKVDSVPNISSSAVLVKLVHVDEVWADLWCEAMGDFAIRTKWPTFAVAQMKLDSTEPLQWLVVEEIYAAKERETEVPPSPARSLSPSETRKRDKKAFMSFTRKASKRMSNMLPPPDDVATPEKKRESVALAPVLPTIEQSPAADRVLSPQANFEHKEVPHQTNNGSSRQSSVSSRRSSQYSIRRVQPPSAEDVFTAKLPSERPKSNDAEVLLNANEDVRTLSETSNVAIEAQSNTDESMLEANRLEPETQSPPQEVVTVDSPVTENRSGIDVVRAAFMAPAVIPLQPSVEAPESKEIVAEQHDNNAVTHQRSDDDTTCAIPMGSVQDQLNPQNAGDPSTHLVLPSPVALLPSYIPENIKNHAEYSSNAPQSPVLTSTVSESGSQNPALPWQRETADRPSSTDEDEKSLATAVQITPSTPIVPIDEVKASEIGHLKRDSAYSLETIKATDLPAGKDDDLLVAGAPSPDTLQPSPVLSPVSAVSEGSTSTSLRSVDSRETLGAPSDMEASPGTKEKKKLSVTNMKRVVTSPFRRRKSSSDQISEQSDRLSSQDASSSALVTPPTPDPSQKKHLAAPQDPTVPAASENEDASAANGAESSPSMAPHIEGPSRPVEDDLDVPIHEEHSFSRSDTLEAVPEVEEEPTQIYHSVNEAHRGPSLQILGSPAALSATRVDRQKDGVAEALSPTMLVSGSPDALYNENLEAETARDSGHPLESIEVLPRQSLPANTSSGFCELDNEKDDRSPAESEIGPDDDSHEPKAAKTATDEGHNALILTPSQFAPDAPVATHMSDPPAPLHNQSLAVIATSPRQTIAAASPETHETKTADAEPIPLLNNHADLLGASLMTGDPVIDLPEVVSSDSPPLLDFDAESSTSFDTTRESVADTQGRSSFESAATS